MQYLYENEPRDYNNPDDYITEVHIKILQNKFISKSVQSSKAAEIERKSNDDTRYHGEAVHDITHHGPRLPRTCPTQPSIPEGAGSAKSNSQSIHQARLKTSHKQGWVY